jgi:ubiquinone/menaquinone biosynthesis C-methylase UbiE
MRTRAKRRPEMFNRMADVYDAEFGAECAVMHHMALAELDLRGADPQRICDVGCGTGALLELMAKRYPAASLTGVDPAEKMTELAQSRLPAARIMVGMAEHLPVAEAEVDLVVSTTSFGQWRDQLAGLREVSRILRPDGIGIIIEHQLPRLLKRLIYRLPDLLTPAQMEAMVRASGLTVREQRVVDDEYLVTVVGHGPEAFA